MPAHPARPVTDRCPGLLRPFQAADGAIVRLRVPGGLIDTATLRAVFGLAAAHGAAAIQLTSRGNLQVRALPDPLPVEFIEGVEATGLLPSASHERVRNILASPLADQLRPLVTRLDAALVADPALAGLPGRFLFAIADATGSVLTEPWDLAYQQLSADSGLLLVGDRGLPVAPHAAVEALLERAHTFLASRPEGAWNIRDLPADSPVRAGLMPLRPAVAAPLVPGAVGTELVAGVPLGLLRRWHVDALAAVADHVVVTPWRSVVVPGGADRLDRLNAGGLVTRPDAAWGFVTACVGAPYCRNTDTPTMRIASEVVTALGVAPDRAVHVVGCDRHCGAPGPAADRSGDRTGALIVVAPTSAQDVLAALPAVVGD